MSGKKSEAVFNVTANYKFGKNYDILSRGHPSDVVLDDVLPQFPDIKFLYYAPRRIIHHNKDEVRWLLANQHSYDAIVLDFSLEPFYLPENQHHEMIWHTRTRKIITSFVNEINIPVIVFHGDPSYHSNTHRYLPTFYFQVFSHPHNKQYCLENVNSQRKYTLSWLNNGPRAHRCHLLTKLWGNNLFNNDNFLYSFYNHQPLDPTCGRNYTSNALGADAVDLAWLEKFCTKSDLNTIKDKLKHIWPHLPVEIDNHDLHLDHYTPKWFDDINDVTNCRAYTDSTAHLVSETSIFTHRFITEKTFKPVAMGMPIFTLHQPHTVSYLEGMGFDMYSDIIDHSYDNEENYNVRFNMLIDSMQNYMQDKPIIPYNRRLKNVENFFSQNMYDQHVANIVSNVREVIVDK